MTFLAAFLAECDNCFIMLWLILTATLPTTPSGLRVRVWRTLKTIGCAPLREGVYLLPADAPTAKDLWAIEQVIRDGGAEAHMLEVRARDEAQEATFGALFDRSEQYADFAQSLNEACLSDHLPKPLLSDLALPANACVAVFDIMSSTSSAARFAELRPFAVPPGVPIRPSRAKRMSAPGRELPSRERS